MLENSFYTNNNIDKQVFNAAAPVTYLSQGTGSYLYLGVNVSGVPAANGDLYQRTTTIIAYFKTDSTGATAPTPLVNDQFTYGTGANGWVNAIITAVTDSGTFWLITVGTAFAGTLTTSTTYTLNILRPNYQWQTWTKPEGRTTAYIVCIGSGASGGSGSGFAAIYNRGGAGGGGSAAITIAQVPFYSIPDTLYIRVALGAIGGAAATGANSNGNNGNSGALSYVSCYPTLDMFNCLVVNGSSVPTGGGAGQGGPGYATAGGGGGGGALSASSTTNPRYLSLCNWASYGGTGGGSGPYGQANGGGTTIAGSLVNSGGGGGAGCSPPAAGLGGVGISGDSLAPFLGANLSGIFSWKPFLSIGGAGGDGNANGTAPPGGKGALSGSGGGGGGSGVTGGAGGNGGNGLVMIISY